VPGSNEDIVPLPSMVADGRRDVVDVPGSGRTHEGHEAVA
jgi:hypothetical protein